jgi:hypothetical protein
MTVKRHGDTTKKANIRLDFLYKTFGPHVFSGQYLDCHATKHPRSLQLLPLGFHEKKNLLPKESALLTELTAMAVQLYSEIIADMYCHMLMNRNRLSFRSCTAEEQPYCMYSTKDKFPCLGACVHMQT